MTLELPEPTHIWFLSFSALRGGWPREEVSGRWKALYLWSEVFQLETRQPIYKAFVLHLSSYLLPLGGITSFKGTAIITVPHA